MGLKKIKNNNKTISVITSTFNRGKLLINLYNSLKEQTCNDFKWLVIDDGSTDDTKDIIEAFIQEKILEIIYLYTRNGGKHRALNKAIDVCDTELFFVVDSDDMLPIDSIEKVILMNDSIANREGFCGVAGLRTNLKNQLIMNSFKDDFFDATSLEATYSYSMFGDKAEVFFTKVLKHYRFPEFEGEKFLTESVLWNKIAYDGFKIRWFNKSIYLCEYRSDGLTKNAFVNAVINCRGESYYHNQESNFPIPLKYKIIHQANYYRYGIFAIKNIIRLIKESKNKKLVLISLPLGIIGAVYTKIKLMLRNYQ